MKWFVSILVFFVLFIFLFVVAPVLTGTKDVKGADDAREKIRYNYSSPCEGCGAARSAGEDFSTEIIQ